MKVLHVTPHLVLGGAERLVVELAGRQSRRRWQVAVAAAPGALQDDLPVEALFFVMPGHPRRPSAIRRWRPPLAEAVQRFRPDLIHTHAIQVTLPFRDLFGRLPVVMTAHSGRPVKDMVSVGMAATRVAHLVAVTECTGPFVRWARSNALRTRITVIENGVDTHFWASDGNARRPGTIAWVGRFESPKQPLLAIDVFERVAAHRDDVALTMAGTGRLAPALAARVAVSPYRNRIAVVGPLGRHELRALYAESDIVLNTSAREGLPMALLEAVAAGCTPVIPALPSLATARLMGSFTFRPDAADDAAEAIQAVLASPSRPNVRGSSLEECEDRYASVYASCTPNFEMPL